MWAGMGAPGRMGATEGTLAVLGSKSMSEHPGFFQN